MGYNSEMEGDIAFESTFTHKKLSEMLKKAGLAADEYKITPNQKNNFLLGPTGGEYYRKHYKDEELARFVSAVIKPGAYSSVEFTGEDGAKWGWFIFHTNPFDQALEKWQLFGIEYHKYLEGMPAEEFIEKYLKENTCQENQQGKAA